MAVLLNLCTETAVSEALTAEGGIEKIIEILNGTKEAQILQFGTGVLRNACKNEKAKVLFISKEGVQLTTKIIKSSLEIPQLLANAIALLGIVCGNDEGNEIFGNIGGVITLIEILKKFENDPNQIQVVTLLLVSSYI